MQTDCFPDAPTAWSKAPIQVLADINPAYRVKRGQTYPFVEMASVAENFGGITRFDTREAAGSGLTRFKAKDTLFAKITPCPENGKVAFVHDLPGDVGLGSTEFIVLSPRDGCVPRFLYHLACAHAVRARAVARMEGSTGRQRVPEEVFTKRLLVPIPPTKEQEAIAHVLDSVEEATRHVTTEVEQARQLSHSLTQEFFYSALGETAYADRPSKHLPVGWTLLPTQNLLSEEPKNGISPPASAQQRGIPTFSIAAVRDGKINLHRPDVLKYIQLPDKAAQLFRLRKNDVLIVRGNANPDLVGKAGIVDQFPDACVYPDITKRVQFRTEGDHIVKPHYAVLAWNHPIVHNQVLRRAKTSNGTLKINSRDVKQIVLPVPPLSEQERLVELVFAVDAKVASLELKRTALEQLKRSLIHDLLTGRIRIDPTKLQSPLRA